MGQNISTATLCKAETTVSNARVLDRELLKPPLPAGRSDDPKQKRDSLATAPSEGDSASEDEGADETRPGVVADLTTQDNKLPSRAPTPRALPAELPEGKEPGTVPPPCTPRDDAPAIPPSTPGDSGNNVSSLAPASTNASPGNELTTTRDEGEEETRVAAEVNCKACEVVGEGSGGATPRTGQGEAAPEAKGTEEPGTPKVDPAEAHTLDADQGRADDDVPPASSTSTPRSSQADGNLLPENDVAVEATNSSPLAQEDTEVGPEVPTLRPEAASEEAPEEAVAGDNAASASAVDDFDPSQLEVAAKDDDDPEDGCSSTNATAAPTPQTSSLLEDIKIEGEDDSGARFAMVPPAVTVTPNTPRPNGSGGVLSSSARRLATALQQVAEDFGEWST